MKNHIKIILGFFLTFLFYSEAAARNYDYDLVVVGGGLSGAAAAVQAARQGLSVAVIEESDFIGGQAGASAVSTMDDLGKTRTGIYMEFVARARDFYAKTKTNTAICLWGADSIAVEPVVARDILTEMMKEAGRVDIFLKTSPTRAHIKTSAAGNKKITGLDAVSFASGRREEISFSGKVFIDATEYGDLLPLSGARYRLGNSVSPNIDPEANVQDITYVAVVKKYEGGLPPDLVMPGMPPEYEKYAPRFREIVAREGNQWPGQAPYDIPSHNAYRALPDTQNKQVILGDNPKSWSRITRTCINWANDYPGRGGGEAGLSVLYIDDRDYREKTERAAMSKTLAFIWYMQSELGMTDWSVDNTQGYGGYFSDSWETADDPLLPKRFAPILRHFPPRPYVREARRVVGVATLNEWDVSRDVTVGRAYQNYPSGLALAEYPIDLHGSYLERYMEHDLNEYIANFPRIWTSKQGVFQLPFEAFIPEELDGLIAAEKNISVSRLVNGATRLHPIVMHTGQAAGAIAAEAVKSGREARDIDVLSAQYSLMSSGQWIALDRSIDTISGSAWWCGVQWASLEQLMTKLSRNIFGAALPIKREELLRLLAAARPDMNFTFGRQREKYVSNGEFWEILDGVKDAKVTARSPLRRSIYERDLSVSRADAAFMALWLKLQASAARTEARGYSHETGLR
ncbi:hypothetical protein AGMMS50276_18320 [Synergistales bacterium]|nr:hypothetical protein AGMMS50276_18320 [Synergistales bacterium]